MLTSRDSEIGFTVIKLHGPLNTSSFPAMKYASNNKSMAMTMTLMTVTMTLMTVSMTLMTWFKSVCSKRRWSPNGSRCSLVLCNIISGKRSVHFVSLWLIKDGWRSSLNTRGWRERWRERGPGQQVIGGGPGPVILEDLDGQLGDQVRESVVDMSQHHLFISVSSYPHLYWTSLQSKRYRLMIGIKIS